MKIRFLKKKDLRKFTYLVNNFYKKNHILSKSRKIINFYYNFFNKDRLFIIGLFDKNENLLSAMGLMPYKNWDNKLHNDYGMFEFNSNKDIYENIARFSYDWDYPIEIGISKDEYHINNAITNYLEELNFMKHKKIKENVLKNNNTEYNKILTMLDIFKNIIFPIISLSNNELKTIALKKNYFYILQKTWSCNNPTSFKDKCGECSKCIKLPTIIP